MDSLTEYLGPEATKWLTLGRDLFTIGLFALIGVLGARRTVRAIAKPKDPELVVVTDKFPNATTDGQKVYMLMGTRKALKAIDRILGRSQLRDAISVDRGGHKVPVHLANSNVTVAKRRSPRGIWTVNVPGQLAADFRAILSTIPGVALTGDNGIALELRTGATLTGPLQREWRVCCKEARQT